MLNTVFQTTKPKMHSIVLYQVFLLCCKISFAGLLWVLQIKLYCTNQLPILLMQHKYKQERI